MSSRFASHASRRSNNTISDDALRAYADATNTPPAEEAGGEGQPLSRFGKLRQRTTPALYTNNSFNTNSSANQSSQDYDPPSAPSGWKEGGGGGTVGDEDAAQEDTDTIRGTVYRGRVSDLSAGSASTSASRALGWQNLSDGEYFLYKDTRDGATYYVPADVYTDLIDRCGGDEGRMMDAILEWKNEFDDDEEEGMLEEDEEAVGGEMDEAEDANARDAMMNPLRARRAEDAAPQKGRNTFDEGYDARASDYVRNYNSIYSDENIGNRYAAYLAENEGDEDEQEQYAAQQEQMDAPPSHHHVLSHNHPFHDYRASLRGLGMSGDEADDDTSSADSNESSVPSLTTDEEELLMARGVGGQQQQQQQDRGVPTGAAAYEALLDATLENDMKLFEAEREAFECDLWEIRQRREAEERLEALKKGDYDAITDNLTYADDEGTNYYFLRLGEVEEGTLSSIYVSDKGKFFYSISEDAEKADVADADDEAPAIASPATIGSNPANHTLTDTSGVKYFYLRDGEIEGKKRAIFVSDEGEYFFFCPDSELNKKQQQRLIDDEEPRVGDNEEEAMDDRGGGRGEMIEGDDEDSDDVETLTDAAGVKYYYLRDGDLNGKPRSFFISENGEYFYFSPDNYDANNEKKNFGEEGQRQQRQRDMANDNLALTADEEAEDEAADLTYDERILTDTDGAEYFYLRDRDVDGQQRSIFINEDGEYFYFLPDSDLDEQDEYEDEEEIRQLESEEANEGAAYDDAEVEDYYTVQQYRQEQADARKQERKEQQRLQRESWIAHHQRANEIAGASSQNDDEDSMMMAEEAEAVRNHKGLNAVNDFARDYGLNGSQRYDDYDEDEEEDMDEDEDEAAYEDPAIIYRSAGRRLPQSDATPNLQERRPSTEDDEGEEAEDYGTIPPRQYLAQRRNAISGPSSIYTANAVPSSASVWAQRAFDNNFGEPAEQHEQQQAPMLSSAPVGRSRSINESQNALNRREGTAGGLPITSSSSSASTPSRAINRQSPPSSLAAPNLIGTSDDVCVFRADPLADAVLTAAEAVIGSTRRIARINAESIRNDYHFDPATDSYTRNGFYKNEYDDFIAARVNYGHNNDVETVNGLDYALGYTMRSSRSASPSISRARSAVVKGDEEDANIQMLDETRIAAIDVATDFSEVNTDLLSTDPTYAALVAERLRIAERQQRMRSGFAPRVFSADLV